MNTIDQRCLSCLLLAACAMMCSGCDRLVGRMEYIRNAMNPSLSEVRDVPPSSMVENETDILGYVPRSPQVIELPPLTDDASLVAYHNAVQSRLRTDYVAQVYGELDALEDALLRLWVVAKQKGMVGVASIDGHLRSFRTSGRIIERYLLQSRAADELEADALRAKINVILSDARATVVEAADDLEDIYEPGYLMIDRPLELY